MKEVVPIVWQIAADTRALVEYRHQMESEPDFPIYRYIEPKSKAGPRGGDDRFRAKAKAGRKANRRRRSA